MTSISSNATAASSSCSIPEQMREKICSRQHQGHYWENPIHRIVYDMLFHLSLRSNSITEKSLTSLGQDRITPAALLQERATRLKDLVQNAVKPVLGYIATFDNMPKELTFTPDSPKFEISKDLCPPLENGKFFKILGQNLQEERIILEVLSKRLDEELEIQKGLLNNTSSDTLSKAISENIALLEGAYQSLFENYTLLSENISNFALYNKFFTQKLINRGNISVATKVTFVKSNLEQASRDDEDFFLPIPNSKWMINLPICKSIFKKVTGLSDPSLSSDFTRPTHLVKDEELSGSILNNEPSTTLSLISPASKSAHIEDDGKESVAGNGSSSFATLNLAKVLSIKSKSKKTTKSRTEDRDLCLALHKCRNLPVAANIDKERDMAGEIFAVNFETLAEDNFRPLNEPITCISYTSVSYFNS